MCANLQQIRSERVIIIRIRFRNTCFPIVLALEAYTITMVPAHANGVCNTHNTLYYPCMVHKSKNHLLLYYIHMYPSIQVLFPACSLQLSVFYCLAYSMDSGYKCVCVLIAVL